MRNNIPSIQDSGSTYRSRFVQIPIDLGTVSDPVRSTTRTSSRSNGPSRSNNLTEPESDSRSDVVNFLKHHKVCLGTCGCIFIFIIILLVPLSFSYVDYDKNAFKKNTMTNKVNTDDVYTNGRYFWGINYRPVTFPRFYNKIELRGNDILIFSDNGLEFSIECDLFYKLDPGNLSNIFTKFGNNYHSRIVDEIKASIKNTGPQYSVEKYILNMSVIHKAIVNNLNHDLSDFHIFIQPNMFFILRIVYPSSLKNKFLETAIQSLENEKSILQRDLDLIKKVTEKNVTNIRANVTVLHNTGKAEANLNLQMAKIKSKALIKNASYIGIESFFEHMNIQNVSAREEILQYFSVLDNTNSSGKILVGDIGTIVV